MAKNNYQVTRLLLLLSVLLASTTAAFTQGSPDIISFLNQTIVWYQQLADQQQLVNEPSDMLFLNDNRQIADQVSRLSFEYARARAQALGNGPKQAQPERAAPNVSQYKTLADAALKNDQKIKETQQEIESMKQQL